MGVSPAGCFLSLRRSDTFFFEVEVMETIIMICLSPVCTLPGKVPFIINLQSSASLSSCRWFEQTPNIRCTRIKSSIRRLSPRRLTPGCLFCWPGSKTNQIKCTRRSMNLERDTFACNSRFLPVKHLTGRAHVLRWLGDLPQRPFEQKLRRVPSATRGVWSGVSAIDVLRLS